MTGGLGFVSSGKDRSRQNRNLLKHTDRVMSKKGEAHGGKHSKPTYKKASKEEIDQLMEGFNQNQKVERRNQIVIGTIVVVIIFTLLYFLIW